MTYQSRLKKLQKILKQEKCDALIIDDPLNLFYLTGLDLSSGKLIVHTKGAHLLVDGRYIESCRLNSPFPVLQSDPPGLDKLLASPELSFIAKLAFDTEKTTYKAHQQLKKIAGVLTANSNSARDLSLVPLDSPLKSLRAVKDAREISALRDAADLGSLGFDFVCTLLKEGISEKECAQELEIFWKRHGSKGVAFDPIIAFGTNSSMPHYRAGTKKLSKGDIVLVDIGVNYKHYHSDMTRIAFYGKPNPLLLQIHKIVEDAQKAALKICRPGTTLGSLDDAARNIIAKSGYGPQFTHSLGHGVGLDIHEFPTIRNAPPYGQTPLAPGMVITIEPGIYLPGIGGIRIEDTVVITKDGYKDLTRRPTEPVRIAAR